MQDKKYPQILIVDDDEQVLFLLEKLLEKNHIESLTSTSAPEALSLIQSTPSIGLVLLDISMPEVSGIELLEKIHKITPSIHVIMITGLGDVETAKKCMRLGAKDFITKPFDLDYLQASVLSVIIPFL